MWPLAADPMTGDNVGCSFSIHKFDRSNRLLGCRAPTPPEATSVPFHKRPLHLRLRTKADAEGQVALASCHHRSGKARCPDSTSVRWRQPERHLAAGRQAVRGCVALYAHQNGDDGRSRSLAMTAGPQRLPQPPVHYAASSSTPQRLSRGIEVAIPISRGWTFALRLRCGTRIGNLTSRLSGAPYRQRGAESTIAINGLDCHDNDHTPLEPVVRLPCASSSRSCLSPLAPRVLVQLPLIEGRRRRLGEVRSRQRRQRQSLMP